jgi:hypothetical protein
VRTRARPCTPDGSQLYFASYSYGEETTLLGRYDVDRDRAETVSLPFGGALGFVVADGSEARSFFPAQLGRKAECPPPTVYPSGRSGPCGFEFRRAGSPADPSR